MLHEAMEQIGNASDWKSLHQTVYDFAPIIGEGKFSLEQQVQILETTKESVNNLIEDEVLEFSFAEIRFLISQASGHALYLEAETIALNVLRQLEKLFHSANVALPDVKPVSGHTKPFPAEDRRNGPSISQMFTETPLEPHQELWHIRHALFEVFVAVPMSEPEDA